MRAKHLKNKKPGIENDERKVYSTNVDLAIAWRAGRPRSPKPSVALPWLCPLTPPRRVDFHKDHGESKSTRKKMSRIKELRSGYVPHASKQPPCKPRFIMQGRVKPFLKAFQRQCRFNIRGCMLVFVRGDNE